MCHISRDAGFTDVVIIVELLDFCRFENSMVLPEAVLVAVDFCDKTVDVIWFS